MYYLYDYLVAVYNHSSSGAVSLSLLGSEIPSSISGRYLPRHSLLFVNQVHFKDMVEWSAPASSSSSGPTVLVSNSIKVSISSSLDPVVFEEYFSSGEVVVF